jgi:hypothetical protein
MSSGSVESQYLVGSSSSFGQSISMNTTINPVALPVLRGEKFGTFTSLFVTQ